MQTDRERSESGVVRAIRRFERRVGAYRPGRSPWVWIIGPGVNFALTIAGVLWVGVATGVGWLVSVPLAVFCGVAMGAMAWLFMGTQWEAEEDERRAAEWLARQREETESRDTDGSRSGPRA